MFSLSTTLFALPRSAEPADAVVREQPGGRLQAVGRGWALPGLTGPRAALHGPSDAVRAGWGSRGTVSGLGLGEGSL